MWVEETISPSTSTSSTTRVSNAALGAQQAGVALRAVAEAEVLAHRHALGADALDQHVVDELLAVCEAKTPSNGTTISSSTPSAGDQVGLGRERREQLRAPPRGDDRGGCGSKVSTVSLPRMTSRWPRWTPSNSPTATCRGLALGVGEPGDLHRRRKPTMGFRVPSAARLGERDQAVRRRAAARRPSACAGHRDAVPRAARLFAAPSRRSGRNASASLEGIEPLRVGVGELERADRSCAAARGSRRRRGRRSASARRCRPSTRSRTRPRSSLRQSSSKRCTLTSRSAARPPRPARPLVRALAVDLHRGVRGRALQRPPVGRVERVAGIAARLGELAVAVAGRRRPAEPRDGP